MFLVLEFLFFVLCARKCTLTRKVKVFCYKKKPLGCQFLFFISSINWEKYSYKIKKAKEYNAIYTETSRVIYKKQWVYFAPSLLFVTFFYHFLKFYLTIYLSKKVSVVYLWSLNPLNVFCNFFSVYNHYYNFLWSCKRFKNFF